MSTQKRGPPINETRRHILGLTVAIGARMAAMGSLAGTLLSSSPAKAEGKAWWKIGGSNPGKGHGNGNGKSGNGSNPGGGPMCLLRGTSIMTPSGEVRIEALRIGDLVATVRGPAMPIKWIGRHVYRRSGPIWNEQVVPVRIARFAIDGQRPHRELYLSAGHALYLDGVLIRATDLVNGTSITPALPDARDTIEYFQIVLDTHEVVLAEGAPVETFLLADCNYEGFTNFVEFARLYPADHYMSMTPFAPIVGYAGREHFKAMLRLASGGLIRPSPLQGAYERIAARGYQLAG
ncbi:Hint domain-containing protein [Sinorhizobium fredii]|uniref:Hint domain-containing protein n=1 Tax=Rhizobium fredii TaxID=380 RepID=UPI0004B7BB86|nr:Hint domain-containing protein [Sinorhizobium fredii]